MEWLILRMHRLHVEKFGPVTTDIFAWIRLYRELLHGDKELRVKMKELKAERQYFDAEIRRMTEEFTQFKNRVDELKEK